MFKILAVGLMLSWNALAQVGSVRVLFPNTQEHYNTMDILDHVDIVSASTGKVVAQLKTMDPHRTVSLPNGEYVAVIDSFGLLKTEKHFTVANQLVRLPLAFLHNYSLKEVSWSGLKVAPGKSFQVWTELSGPFFIPLKGSGEELGGFSVNSQYSSLYSASDTVGHDGFEECVSDMAAQLFLLERGSSYTLNNIPLGSASFAGGLSIFPVGVVRVNLPWGMMFSLTHAASGKAVTFFTKCDMDSERENRTDFDGHGDFLLPVGQYQLNYQGQSQSFAVGTNQVLELNGR